MILDCHPNFWIFTKLSSEGGKRVFSIISALMKPELYFHPSPGLGVYGLVFSCINFFLNVNGNTCQ